MPLWDEVVFGRVLAVSGIVVMVHNSAVTSLSSSTRLHRLDISHSISASCVCFLMTSVIVLLCELRAWNSQTVAATFQACVFVLTTVRWHIYKYHMIMYAVIAHGSNTHNQTDPAIYPPIANVSTWHKPSFSHLRVPSRWAEDNQPFLEHTTRKQKQSFYRFSNWWLHVIFPFDKFSALKSNIFQFNLCRLIMGLSWNIELVWYLWSLISFYVFRFDFSRTLFTPRRAVNLWPR